MILRIKSDTHDRLRDMARQANQNVPDFVENMIREHERRQFLEGLNTDFARLQKSPIAWQSEMSDRKAFDSAYVLDEFMTDSMAA